MKKKTHWWVDIDDKIKISDNRFCPPHYIPHKLPFGKKICDEKCHLHKAKWRMAHHMFYCKFLGCKNYEFMVEKNKEFLLKSKKEE